VDVDGLLLQCLACCCCCCHDTLLLLHTLLAHTLLLQIIHFCQVYLVFVYQRGVEEARAPLRGLVDPSIVSRYLHRRVDDIPSTHAIDWAADRRTDRLPSCECNAKFN
jgi:hypothetical protein